MVTITLPTFYLATKEQVKIRYDPYTLKPLTDDSEYF